MTPKQIGKLGEELITSLLPGAEDVSHQLLPYDVLWNGIKIDVKTSKVPKYNGFLFRIHPKPVNKGVILVMVGVSDERNYYWVRPYSNYPQNLYNKDDALTEDELAQEIIAISKGEFEDIDVLISGVGLPYVDKHYAEILSKLAAKNGRTKKKTIEIVIMTAASNEGVK